MNYSEYESPIGMIRVAADDTGVRKIMVTDDEWEAFCRKENPGYRSSGCRDAIKQLDEYFCGKRRHFDIPLSLQTGTAFQQKVWQVLKTIPYGETRSYADVALDIRNPKAVRAVGQANRANPLPIVIPCHRVIGKNGSLTGYAGPRTDIKAYLLGLEGVTT